ncbi:hypothetical protein [Synechocystis sp. CACIAM 05]|nr:hypothetical protein [Synechocystis sp. CACIAM 05]
MAGFQELEQIIWATGFGAYLRHFETTEGLAGNDRLSDKWITIT